MTAKTNQTQIIVALIGLVGTVLTVSITQWDKIFPEKAEITVHPLIIEVPELVGLHIDSAKGIIKKAGLKIDKIESLPIADERFNNEVITQSPVGGTKLTQGSIINLMIGEKFKSNITQSASLTEAVSDTRKPMRVNPSWKIPSLNAEVKSLLFFETPYDLLPLDQRTYHTRFSRGQSRYIAWEVNLKFPSPSDKTNFEIQHFYYSPEGEIIFSSIKKSYLDPSWGNSWHASGYGFNNQGEWKPGLYTVDLYVQKDLIAKGSFEIY